MLDKSMSFSEESDKKKLRYDIKDEKVQYLISTDVTLGRLIRFINNSELLLEMDGFKCLVKYVIGQQISDKARETIWKRIQAIYKNISPEKILMKDVSVLREAGLSGRKSECIKRLADEVINRNLDFKAFDTLQNDEIIHRLTMIKGIGQWTAEMYLIYSLGRENVLSKGDKTIRRVIQWMYNLDQLPSKQVLESYFDKWSQYSTIVSAYLWRAVELGLNNQQFDRVISK